MCFKRFACVFKVVHGYFQGYTIVVAICGVFFVSVSPICLVSFIWLWQGGDFFVGSEISSVS